MSCSTEKILEIYEETDDISMLERVVKKLEDEKRMQYLVARAKREGYYTVPSKKIAPYLDYGEDLKGKSIMLESTSNGKARFVQIKNTEMVAPRVVSINDGEIVVNLDENITTDYNEYVTLGSSKDKVEGQKLTEITGTVVQNLDEVVSKLVQEDGEALKSDFQEYLENIFQMYKDVLQESGKDVDINVELFKALDEHEGSKGTADPKLGKIRLLLGNTKNRTNTEILAEELQHVMINRAIKTNPKLRHKIEQLRTAMAKELNKDGKGYEVFLADKENATATDVEIAKEAWEYAFENDTWPADEFLAHATTNERLVRALAGVKTSSELELISPIEGKNKDKIWAKIWNQIVKMLNEIYSGYKFNQQNAHEYAVDLLVKLLEVEHRIEREKDKSRYEKILDAISRADDKVARYTEQIDNEHKTHEEWAKSKTAKAKNIVASIWKIRGMAKVRSFILQNNLFSSVSKNLKNQDVAKFYEMFRHSKEFVEKEVVAVKQRTALMLEETWGLGEIPVGQREAAKRVILDIDGKVLGTSAQIAEYLNDEAKVDAELVELTKDYSGPVMQAIEDLADLLVTNRSNNPNLYTNASQIAYYMVNGATKETIESIDRAITLRAMQKLDKQDKTLAASALASNPQGFNKTMELIREEQREVLEQAYKGEKLHEMKGSKQESFRKDKKRYLVPKKEMQELVKAGMHNLGIHSELSALSGEEIYTVIGDSLDTKYSEGLLKVVQLSNEGDSLKYTLMKLTDMTEEDVEVRLEILRKADGFKNTGLVPERTISGEIYDYRMRISYEEKVKYMEMDQDIISTVASTVANLTHKQEAMMSNYASLTYLRNFYESYKGSDEFKFVEIGPNSEGKFKEYWDMLPHYIKNTLENSGKPLMVTESMLVDYFGYSDVSLVNAPWIRDKKKRQMVVKKLESMMMEMTRYFKLIIVAFTWATVKANNLSNMVVTLTHTKTFKNPLEYMKQYRRVWSMMNDYQKLRTMEINLELRKKAGEGGLDKKISAVKAKMKANPVHPIIEDGQYSVIFEDLNTSYFNNEGIIEGKINEVIGKAEGKNGKNMLKSLVDVVYLRKDTAIHDSIMKATTYSDVISKVIILMDAQEHAAKLKRDGKSNKEIGSTLYSASEKQIEGFLENGKVPQAWLNHVDGLFVNYGYLDNRYIKYANDVDIFRFTKYFFRVFPAMAKLIATKAASFGVIEGIQRATPGRIETPMDQYFDPFKSLWNRLGVGRDDSNFLETIMGGPLLR